MRTEVVPECGRGAVVADAVAPAAEGDGPLDVDSLYVCGDVGLEEVDGFGDRDRDRHEHEELLRGEARVSAGVLSGRVRALRRQRLTTVAARTTIVPVRVEGGQSNVGAGVKSSS